MDLDGRQWSVNHMSLHCTKCFLANQAQFVDSAELVTRQPV